LHATLQLALENRLSIVNYITVACGEVKYFHSPTIPLFTKVTFRTHNITQTFVEIC
jgi:hypothetical protein